MPQFDKITFLNQFFWLSLFFIFLFFICNNFLLPKLCVVFKARFKKVQKKNTFFILYQEELNGISNSIYFILDSSIAASEQTFLGVSSELEYYSASFENFLNEIQKNSFENFEHTRRLISQEINNVK